MVVICILFSIGLTGIFYSLYMIKEVKEVDMLLKVSDVVGLNTDSDAIKFGIVPPAGIGTRTFILKNDYEIPLKTYIEISGDIKPFIRLEDNYFWLNPGEQKEIKIYADVPKDAEFGEYKGKMRVLLKRK